MSSAVLKTQLTQGLDTLRDRACQSTWAMARVLGYDKPDQRVHLPLCQWLDTGVRRQNFIMPRGFLKTTVAKIHITRLITENPELRVLLVSNTLDNAVKKVRSIRRTISSAPLWRRLYGNLIPNIRQARWSDMGFELVREHQWDECTVEAAGIGTTIIGRHYDVLVLDDIVNSKKDDRTGIEYTPSLEEIEKAVNWVREAGALANNRTTFRIINLGTRWAVHDVIGWILSLKYYKTFLMRARDSAGVSNWPEEFPEHVLRELEMELGPYLFNAMYMCDPQPSETLPFRKEWVSYYNEAPKGLRNIMTVDLAISQKEEACNTVVMVIGVDEKDGKRYLVDYVAARMTPPETINQIFALHQRHNCVNCGIESVAYQKALRYFMQDEMTRRNYWFMVDDFQPGAGETKDKRIRGLVPLFASGLFLFKPTHKEFEGELLQYPYAKTCDCLDAAAYHMQYAPMLSLKVVHEHGGPFSVAPDGGCVIHHDYFLDEIERDAEVAWSDSAA